MNKLITNEINKTLFRKQYNLSGEFSNDGGFDLYNKVSFITFKPHLGPVVKLNVLCTNSNASGTQSKLTLKRVNGISFYFQFWFSVIFATITAAIGIFMLFKNGPNTAEVLYLPIFGIVYLFVVNLIADSTTKDLISRIEKILKNENIIYRKL